MWGIVFGVLGFIMGLFLWSTVFGRFIEIVLTKKASLPNNTLLSILSLIIGLVLLGLGSYYLDGFMIGAIASGIAMLFNIGKLQQEVIESIEKKHGHE